MNNKKQNLIVIMSDEHQAKALGFCQTSIC